MNIIKDAATAVVKKAIAIAPDSWIPGGAPDPLISHRNGLIGAAISRLDGPAKVTGAAPFAAEFTPDGMAYVALVFSTIAKGKIVQLDIAAAESASGVLLVMTYKNAPRLKPPPMFGSMPKAASGDTLPVMQDAEIHWNGQPIALVLAESQEQADHAKSLIKVSYKEEAATTSVATAQAQGLQQGLFHGEPLKLDKGDAEAALAKASYKVDVTYQTPRHNHNAIEPHAATVMWTDGRLFVHDASQCVDHTAWSLAQIFGIDEKDVDVTSPFVGGGFGGKTLWQHQILAAAAAQLVQRPVRITLSREGVYRLVGGRTVTEQRLAIGARADGTFEAIIHTGTTVMSRHNAMPEPFILPTQSAYAAENIKLDVKVAVMDVLANTFMRAPGESVGTFALESAIDELADQLNIDPVELRRINEPKEDPTTGLPFSARHTIEAYKAGAARFGWDQRQAPGTVREGDWLIGMGVATATYPYHRMPGGAASIKLTKDGHATVAFSAHEMGMGTSTTHTIVVAERLGLPMAQVTVQYGDSRMPGVILAGGSQQTAAIGAAVIAAHRELVKELLKLAGNDSPLAGLKPDEVGGLNGGLCKLDNHDVHESYISILSRANKDEVSVEAAGTPPIEVQHWSMHSHGAIFCEVRVSAVTGEVRVSRMLGSFDCGRILNAKTAASQFRGGMIMGIGLALMEETQLDERNGRVANPNLSDYHIPVHLDVPEIEVLWTDIADPHAPMGARGIGEIGITGVGAAIANAVYNATGKRIRDLPITLDKLLVS